ncbi:MULTISPECIES: hypothetical protein [unclassified Ruegeria]|nr:MULTISPECIES: hypothetical protein [unclassified Ruegeria]MBO9413287.1 hypothetical protein [Ruegeria sp. R8_1]MBO9413951.1 hypothetical protein [Ruegeria sp. R8_2]
MTDGYAAPGRKRVALFVTAIVVAVAVGVLLTAAFNAIDADYQGLSGKS